MHRGALGDPHAPCKKSQDGKKTSLYNSHWERVCEVRAEPCANGSAPSEQRRPDWNRKYVILARSILSKNQEE